MSTKCSFNNKNNKVINKGNDEIWKNDTVINSLLGTRKVFPHGSSAYRLLTKKLKARVNKLKNEKLAKEALDINQYESKKQVPAYPALCCPPDKLACMHIRTHLHASINGTLFSVFSEKIHNITIKTKCLQKQIF